MGKREAAIVIATCLTLTGCDCTGNREAYSEARDSCVTVVKRFYGDAYCKDDRQTLEVLQVEPLVVLCKCKVDE